MRRRFGAIIDKYWILQIMLMLSYYILLLYTIFDCIDGIRARLTGKSSPFGELLDHTLDYFAEIPDVFKKGKRYKEPLLTDGIKAET